MMTPEWISIILSASVAISAIISNILKIRVDAGTLSARAKGEKPKTPNWSRLLTYSSAFLMWAVLALWEAPVTRAFVVSVNVVTAFFICNFVLEIVNAFLKKNNG